MSKVFLSSKNKRNFKKLNIFIVFNKKKEDTTTSGNNKQATITSPVEDINANANASTHNDNQQHSQAQDNVNNSNAEKKAKFSFLNKKKTSNEGKEKNSITGMTSGINNTISGGDLNVSNASNSNLEKKPGGGNFKFIKSKAGEGSNKNLPGANTKSNMENVNQKQTLTLDNLLMTENFFGPAEPREGQAQDSKLESETNTGNIGNLNVRNEIENPSPLNNNLQQQSFTENENKSKAKIGFNFVKKKAGGENIGSKPIINETEENANINYNEHNKSVNDDANSDCKSFKSLRYNNNIKQDDISVNLDINNEDDNKSIHNMNNISAITNPLKEYKDYLGNPITNSASSKNAGYPTHEKKLSSTTNQPHIKQSIKDINTLPAFKSTLPVSNDPEVIKKRCYEEIQKSEDSVKDLILKIHNLKNKLQIKEKELQNLENKLDDLYQKENEAIENNDFDEAQSIENTITEIKESITKINFQIEENKMEMIQFREQELLIIRNKFKIMDDTLNSFSKLKNQQEFELETFLNTDMTRHKNDNIKIKKMKEKLDFLKNNLDSDKIFIDEEEEKINKVIKSQSSGVFEELDQLNKEKSDILEEIEQIKKLLDKKYAELDTVEKSIESKEIEIDVIKSNFNHEFNKINFKKKNYEENLKDFEVQEEQYHVRIKLYQNEKLKFEGKMENMEKTITDLESELNGFKKGLSTLTDDLNRKEFLLKNENEVISKIHLVQLKYEKTNKIKEKNLEEIQSLELSIKRLESELVTIDMRVPSLEEEKKSFVNVKNFKEAGRVSNELKALIENKNKNLNKIEENKNKIQDLKIENENLAVELHKINEMKQSEEKDLNITKFDYLITYKEQLNGLIKNIENSAYKSGSSHNNDMYYLENEAELLNAEMKQLEKFSYIKEKFSSYFDKETGKEKEENDENNKVEEGNEDKYTSTQNDPNANSELKSDNVCNSEEINQDQLEQEDENVNEEEIKSKIEELNADLQKCIEVNN